MASGSDVLQSLATPAAIIDAGRMQRNIARMQARVTALGARFRPHVKTSKCLPVIRAQLAAGAAGVTVSTLAEAEQCFAAGVRDILYAVGIAPQRLPQVLALRRRGCLLKIITDNAAAARAITEFGRAHGEAFEVWIEVDVDGHRGGVPPGSPSLLEIATLLHAGGARLGGVLAHAGSSYELNNPEALARLAQQERDGCLHAAQRLRDHGLPCPEVSIGSTPTALSATMLEGITEVRAGVYVFFDLVMRNVGICTIDELALSVLTTVIGHQEQKGQVIVDAGWMAMSRDLGTSRQATDYGYGQVCGIDGQPLAGWRMIAANQEHGILAGEEEAGARVAAMFPVGTRLRILPNHACATGAQFPCYWALTEGRLEQWSRGHGW